MAKRGRADDDGSDSGSYSDDDDDDGGGPLAAHVPAWMMALHGALGPRDPRNFAPVAMGNCGACSRALPSVNLQRLDESQPPTLPARALGNTYERQVRHPRLPRGQTTGRPFGPTSHDPRPQPGHGRRPQPRAQPRAPSWGALRRHIDVTLTSH